MYDDIKAKQLSLKRSIGKYALSIKLLLLWYHQKQPDCTMYCTSDIVDMIVIKLHTVYVHYTHCSLVKDY